MMDKLMAAAKKRTGITVKDDYGPIFEFYRPAWQWWLASTFVAIMIALNVIIALRQTS